VTATWFHVEITDPATGCTIIDSIEVGVHPPVDAIISGTDMVCEGDDGELTITFTGPAPYEINITGPDGPLPIISGILVSPYTLLLGDDGDYIITYVTGDGCEGTFSGTGTIDVIVPFSVDIESSATYCDGDPMADISVVSTDGGIVNWYDNPGLIPPAIGTGLTFTPSTDIGTTVYYAAETEGVLGCEGPADEVTITINPIPPAPTYSGITEYCEDDVATALNGNPALGGTITWYDAPPPGGAILEIGPSYTPGLIAPGMTIYLTETADGCESEATEVIITVSPTPEPPIVDGVFEYCEGEIPTAITATIGSGGIIEWRNESGTVLETGTTFTPTLVVGETTILVYEVLGGCQSEPTSITLLVQAAPTVIVPDTLSICLGDSVYVETENNGYDISWSDGQIGGAVWLSPETTTLYTVTATNPACGSSEDELTIIVYELPTITSSNDTVIGVGGDLELWAYSDDATYYNWTPAVYSCITSNCSEVYVVPEATTLYIVTVTDKNNCSNSDSVLVDLNGVMDVFIPNIFSPNGDGSNDKLVIYGPRLFEFNMEIYDRWGKRVYVSDDQKSAWDGTFKDQLLPPQTFVYIFTGETILGEPIRLEGNVTIIK
ncbi:gliding motility-associated C-terminal domain-containing protein, partial [Crocinitomix sp.]|nr:gliding motility-associated C-terminal domain-containing protein [Crocinitomix sp.]